MSPVEPLIHVGPEAVVQFRRDHRDRIGCDAAEEAEVQDERLGAWRDRRRSSRTHDAVTDGSGSRDIRAAIANLIS